jgi:uncharacterized protein (DUF433 family)
MAETDREDGDATAATPRIVRTPDVLGGDPRIEGTRVGVVHVYRRYVEGGDAPAEIAAGYDISVAAVHTALAYAFANAEEMTAIAERNEAAREAAEPLTPDDH